MAGSPNFRERPVGVAAGMRSAAVAPPYLFVPPSGYFLWDAHAEKYDMVTERQRDFIREVEAIARLMCEQFDLGPEDTVITTYRTVRLPSETMNIDLDTQVAARRWETFRREAAFQLAGFRAVNTYFLLEK